MDKTHVLICPEKEVYLSIILMPAKLYDEFADHLIDRHTNYFWDIPSIWVGKEEANALISKLFNPFGKLVSVKDSSYKFYLVGSIPYELTGYIKEII